MSIKLNNIQHFESAKTYVCKTSILTRYMSIWVMLQCNNNLFRLNNLRHGKISANDWWVRTRIEQIHPAPINLSGTAVRAFCASDVAVSNERRAYRARINNRKMLFLISPQDRWPVKCALSCRSSLFNG